MNIFDQLEELSEINAVNTNRLAGFTNSQGEELTIVELRKLVSEERARWLSGFGLKMCWHMIKEQEIEAKGWSLTNFANALDLDFHESLHWNDGVELVYLVEDSLRVFITPALNGWIYILKLDDYLNLLDGVVDNYYAFGNYKELDYVSWKQVKAGNTVRHFRYANGVVTHNIGAQTKEECDLGFIDLTGLDNEQAYAAIAEQVVLENNKVIDIPKQFDVSALCKAWTNQNPMEFDFYPIDTVKERGIAGFGWY